MWGETTKNAASAYSPDVLSLMLKIYGGKTREQKDKIERIQTHETHRSRPQRSTMQQGMDLGSYCLHQLLCDSRSHLQPRPRTSRAGLGCLRAQSASPHGSSNCHCSTTSGHRGLCLIPRVTASPPPSASEIFSCPCC